MRDSEKNTITFFLLIGLVVSSVVAGHALGFERAAAKYDVSKPKECREVGVVDDTFQVVCYRGEFEGYHETHILFYNHSGGIPPSQFNRSAQNFTNVSLDNLNWTHTPTGEP